MGDAFFVGVNLPWLTYGCDFGANAWQPGGGVSAPERARRLDEVFARLAAGGLTKVRWFVLCDGRAGIEFDAAGVPRGLDALFFRDFDAALALASRHGLGLIPVLFDYLWCRRRRVLRGVATGGRRRLLARDPERAVLLDRVVRPLLSRYGTEPAIHAWDVFNEPEWATLGYGSLNPATAVRPATMRAVLADLTALVHAEARQPVTIGLAARQGLRLVAGVPIDILQLHWYDRRSASLPEPPEDPARASVFLGEFPTAASGRSPEEVLLSARACGYAGALGWSALARDQHSDLGALERAVAAWNGAWRGDQ